MSSALKWHRLAVLLTLVATSALATPQAGIAASSGQIVTGRVSFDVADGFASRRSSREAMLDIGTERLALTGIDDSQLVPGTELRVRGLLDDSTLDVSGAPETLAGPTTFHSTAVQGVAPMSPRVAVLLV